LLRQGAKLVETAQDVLEELQGLAPPATAASPPASERASALESDLLAALGFDPLGLDDLVARTGWSAARLQAALLELELAGRVARLPGGMFQRLERG
jgi:DNA processing protein